MEFYPSICCKYIECRSRVIWWPYYSTFINSTSSLPTSNLVTQFRCNDLDFSYLNGTVLKEVYSTDVTLRYNLSPYYVVYNVVINENVTMIIEGGVEIIFLEDGYFTIIGTMIAGCLEDNDVFVNIIHFHGESNDRYKKYGRIRFSKQGMGHGYFCNVLFESMSIGISMGNHYSIDQYLYVNNSGFKDNKYGLCLETKDWTYTDHDKNKFIYNSLFDGNEIAIKSAWYASIDNCTIKNSQKDGIHLHHTDVTNSEIIGQGYSYRSTCVVVEHFGNNLINNTVSNCSDGFQFLIL